MSADKMRRTLKPDAQGFDEVRIVTVPRFKTSGLSGDEWRISAKIQLLRKGRVAFEEGGFSDVRSAVTALGWFFLKAHDTSAYFAGEGQICDQEGCTEIAAVAYRLKARFCRDGHREEARGEFRLFCQAHRERGDCSLEDSDSNYEEIPLAQVQP